MSMARPVRAKGTMGDLEIVTTGDRHDLDEQARDAFRACWPEFIFHDPISSEHIGRVETYFPQYDVLLLDKDQVVAGGWGVPIQWDGTIGALPAGYDGALISAVAGRENSVPADTLCIMAAAVKADRQGSGLAGQALTALRGRATDAGLQHVIAPVRPMMKSRYPLTPNGGLRALDQERRPPHRPGDPHTPAAWSQHPLPSTTLGGRPALTPPARVLLASLDAGRMGLS